MGDLTPSDGISKEEKNVREKVQQYHFPFKVEQEDKASLALSNLAFIISMKNRRESNFSEFTRKIKLDINVKILLCSCYSHLKEYMEYLCKQI